MTSFVRSCHRSFVEVYVTTSLEECERRDTKGLYARARRGEPLHLPGVGEPYEPPEHPDVVAVSGTDDAATDSIVALVTEG